MKSSGSISVSISKASLSDAIATNIWQLVNNPKNGAFVSFNLLEPMPQCVKIKATAILNDISVPPVYGVAVLVETAITNNAREEAKSGQNGHQCSDSHLPVAQQCFKKRSRGEEMAGSEGNDLGSQNSALL